LLSINQKKGQVKAEINKHNPIHICELAWVLPMFKILTKNIKKHLKNLKFHPLALHRYWSGSIQWYNMPF
jgi:hypothetical protein